MLVHEGLDRNFQFIVLEVGKQVERVRLHLDTPDDHLMRQIRSRDDYIDHLKSIIANKCYAYLQEHGNLAKRTVDLIRSINVVASNLERIADHAVNIVTQTNHFSQEDFLHRYDYDPFFREITAALELVPEAFDKLDTTKAVQICNAEVELDDLYRAKVDRILAEMASGRGIPDYVTAMMIFHYLERMGDCLLNIGEAIIFCKVGEKLKFHQFQSLHDTLSAVHPDEMDLDSIDFEGIWGTRSGARIGKVSTGASSVVDGDQVVYKEGDLRKIKLEKEKIELWNQLVPGLPPRIVEYQENERDATLLIEYLNGSNLQEIAITTDPDFLDEGLEAVQHTVRQVWLQTRTDQPAHAAFLGQLTRRLGDVVNVHPDFSAERKQIGGLTIPNVAELLHRNQDLDEVLAAPISVLGHGDFNLDNVIYDPARKQVHFIDLHRSAPMDYLQDIAVIMVSSFRLPVFDPAIRRRLNRVIASFFDFGVGFAEEIGDETFEIRLTLGLVRSFLSSTRFELDREFAQDMRQRAIYLLRKVDAHRDRPWESFEIPRDVLFY